MIDQEKDDDITTASQVARRTVKVNTRMTQAMYDRLLAIADEYGQTPATISSLALAEWIRQREMQHIPLQGMIEVFREKIDHELSSFDMASVQGAILQGIEKQEKESFDEQTS